MNRNKLLGAILCTLCLALGVWSSQIAIFESQEFVHDDELNRITEALDRYAQSLPADDQQAQFVTSSVHNLLAAHDGSTLVDRNSLLGLTLLSVMVLALAILLTLASPQVEQSRPRSWFSRPTTSANEGQEIYQQQLLQTAEDLQQAYLELNQKDPSMAQKGDGHPSQSISAHFDHIVRIESHLGQLKGEVLHTMSNVKDIADRLQRLSAQCEDNAHFTAATRLEWNAMGTKIRQMAESHNKLKSTADKMTKQQQGCHELISKSLSFNQRHDEHAENARDQVARMNEISKETLSTLDLLAGSMAESNQDVGSASALVRGLSERAEEIVNIIDVIDDIAEQTNQLALNASIEAARAGEQGQGFAVVAGEVRNLAARSSTATKSITDLLGTIQQEADHASACLEKSRKSVEIAHSKMLEVDHSYREAVTISRQALSELNHIVSSSVEHMQEMKAIEKQSHELKKYFNAIHNQLEEQGRLNRASYSECNQLTIHSDRLSRLMQRQYFEIAHCDRMVEGTFFTLDHIKSKMEESLASSDSLRKYIEREYEWSLRADVSAPGGSAKVARAMATLQAATRNLSVIGSPAESVQSQLADIYLNMKKDPDSEAPAPVQDLQGGDVLIGESGDQQKAG